MNTIAAVIKNGFAENNKEQRAESLVIAAPVFSSKGVIGAINLIVRPESATIDDLRTDYTPK